MLNPRCSYKILDLTRRMKVCIAILDSASLEELDDGDTNGFQIGLSRYEHRPRELESVRL